LHLAPHQEVTHRPQVWRSASPSSFESDDKPARRQQANSKVSVVFPCSAVNIDWFVLGLKTGWSFARKDEAPEALEAVAEKATVLE
jgi:hypothetical protein